MKAFFFILLLVLSVNVSSGYAYDVELNASNYKVFDLELQNQYYDDNQSLCYSGRRCISYSQKKTRDRFFFEFELGLVAAKGADETVDVFRVFGGDARAQGFSFTTVDPRSVSNFRNAAGLPSGGASGATNTADFLIKGKAKVSDVIKFKSADPLDGNKCGLPEFIINPKNVDITDFSVLKP